MRFHSSSNNIRVLAIILLFGVAAWAGCNQDKKQQETPKEGRQLQYTEEVTFLDETGDPITSIEAAVADDQMERNQGLMDVNRLPSDKGMLFIFDDEEPLSFWMANTPLSLDIIFADSEKEIVRIHHSTQPFAEKNLTSGRPAIYVVETNGGFCVSHDIREGHSIAFDLTGGNGNGNGNR